MCFYHLHTGVEWIFFLKLLERNVFWNPCLVLHIYLIYCYIMDKFEPPQSFSFEGNVSQGGKLWLNHFEFYWTATELDRKNNKVKTSVLLTCIGQKGRKIYETFNFDNPCDEMRLHLCYRGFLNTATQERTSIYLFISFSHIDNTKGKTSMTSSQNWKNLVQNVHLKFFMTL